MNNISYTYLIGWSAHNVWYYGVRFQKNCKPADLWVTYFTSSKHVKKFVKEHSDPDIKEIRKIFTNSKSARYWEHKVLRRLNAKDDARFLNQTNGDGRFFNLGHTEETRKLLSKKLKGKVRSSKFKEHLSIINKGKLAGEKNGMFNKKHSEEAKKKIAEASRNREIYFQTGKTYEEIQKDPVAAEKRKKKHSEWMKENNPFKGKKHSEETKAKMRLAAQNRKLKKEKEQI